MKANTADMISPTRRPTLAHLSFAHLAISSLSLSLSLCCAVIQFEEQEAEEKEGGGGGGGRKLHPRWSATLNSQPPSSLRAHWQLV